MERIVKDRLCRNADLLWFDDTMDEIVTEVTSTMESSLLLSLHRTFVRKTNVNSARSVKSQQWMLIAKLKCSFSPERLY